MTALEEAVHRDWHALTLLLTSWLSGVPLSSSVLSLSPYPLHTLCPNAPTLYRRSEYYRRLPRR